MVKNTEINLSTLSRDLKKNPSDAVVIGVGQGADGPVLLDNPLTAKSAEALADSLQSLGITGAADQLVRLPGLPETGAGVLALAGVGKVSAGSPLGGEALRRAAGSAVRQLAGLATVALAFPTASVADVAAVAEGAALGAYSFTEFRSSKDGLKDPVRNAVIFTELADGRELGAVLKRAAQIGRAVNATRSLVNQPPSHLYPETFAEAARDLAKGLPVKVTVWDEKRLEKEGFGGIMGVGKGSARQPRLVKVEYSPTRATSKIALVGKGITFDTGGLSLKPREAMVPMKTDMAGATTVLAAALGAAELGLPVRVTAVLPLAENAMSGSSYRPGDVVRTFGGTTVEVSDTDAEGRLVLADALAWTAATLTPDAVVDVATLTGAAARGLGRGHAALFATGDDLADELLAAGEATGERAWRMPLVEDYRPALDSAVADVAHRATDGHVGGGAVVAALFLQRFAGSSPWAHLDIAGPARAGKGDGELPAGAPTGHGTRLLLRWLESLSAARPPADRHRSAAAH